MADDVVRDIPEEMVEKAARAAFDAMKTGVFEAWSFDDLKVHRHHQERWRTAARAVLSAALAGRTVLPEPESHTLPTFQGCTDADPFTCACSDGPICCDACGDEIEQGMPVFMARVPNSPWMNAHEQEWTDFIWHDRCDLRAAGSGSGEG